MCCFSRPIESVAKTQLTYTLFRHLGKRFALQTYANQVRTANPTAMILPVPCKPEQIQLMNQEGSQAAKHLFDTVFRLFEEEVPRMRSFGGGGFGSLGSSTLAVIQSGSYHVSIVPTLAEFSRLDPSIFTFDPVLTGLLANLPFKGDWCYLACVLRRTAEYQPFSYVYEVASDAAVGFIPTQHYHPHGTVPSEWKTEHTAVMMMTDSSLAPPSTGRYHYINKAGVIDDLDWVDDWDHEIMIMGVSSFVIREPIQGGECTKLKQTCARNPYVQEHMGALINGFTHGQHQVQDCAYRIEIKGRHRNLDVTFPILEHGGVWCDVCKQTITQGVRYKCMACKDIDICEACHSAKRLVTGEVEHDGKLGHILVELKNAEDTKCWKAFMDGCVEDKIKLDMIKMAMTKDSSSTTTQPHPRLIFEFVKENPVHTFELGPAARGGFGVFMANASSSRSLINPPPKSDPFANPQPHNGSIISNPMFFGPASEFTPSLTLRHH